MEKRLQESKDAESVNVDSGKLKALLYGVDKLVKLTELSLTHNTDEEVMSIHQELWKEVVSLLFQSSVFSIRQVKMCSQVCSGGTPSVFHSELH